MHKPLPLWAWSAILLLLVCLSRISIDIYLPSLPAMADALHASDAQLQLTLSLFMAGSAASMLVCGPLADRHGRRPVLLAGMAIYLLASIVCACATSAPVLIAARVLQAFGGCSGTIICRVMVRDRFDPATQARMLGRISMGMGLSPIVAPLLGSVLEVTLGWRAVFMVLCALGFLSVLLIARYLPETKPANAVPHGNVLRLYRRLLGDAYFLRYALAIGFVYCTYFPFIAESSVLLQRGWQLSPGAYALVFGLTVSGYMTGSKLFQKWGPRHGADRMLGLAVALNLAGAASLLVLGNLAPWNLASLVVPMMVVMLSVGMAIPACQLAVLQPYGAQAGSASGLFFFIQMAITSACGALIAALSDGSAQPMLWVTAGASAAFAAVCLLSARVRAPQASMFT
ncbi:MULTISPECIES: multidrug effflux MFS transporter [unclassified Janthinobacterium]|uniref:multidrug effflux MFS transporter n=1 Tax=unclassified Janthinobacterium TaxID=2610881 RepID=UPI001608DE30|nr:MULTISPECIES: multidrug effflux MFS transporter [unclassified Janthinobacterium]MBB5371474.1 DHA1 family bicyclomycin/chloramphenicol resistance-like MFS transporter [Janthinobacterium sp. K2C7]MBB5384280.1 DHA1 family bicyclomycin/chloramphenicol resistance-like MFS transporter [Janthinobacterium sp. K2Li3]MBB5389555.1 DHA1 family bicyclomycin/chloramphenicol resistance-like MFS transporter [Janthinobacterium sp. K2E3]